ncbi:MAG: phytanoyl-CoA dioxygenase family protein [candidate division Zixibacteria bacterium]|nr:phytanoyl-CoA dioxygenase family protein [candidate division Zixibacteria bacterium]
MTIGLTDTQKRFYLEEGYLSVERLFDPARLDPLIEDLNAVVDEWTHTYRAQGRLRDVWTDEPFERRLHAIYRAMDGQCAELLTAVGGKRKTDAMFSVLTLSEILDLVESVIGPEILVHPQFNSRAKLPDGTSVVHWHQDIGFLDPDVDDTFMVNFWVPLVDADERNGCLEVIPKSHRLGRLPFGESPEDIIAEHLPKNPSVSCPIPKGGALMIQHRTVHRSGPNFSDGIRWSLDIRYSDWRKPTGRASVPGFIGRSRLHPERVTHSLSQWLALFTDASP